jgi:hypothetical protein
VNPDTVTIKIYSRLYCKTVNFTLRSSSDRYGEIGMALGTLAISESASGTVTSR